MAPSSARPAGLIPPGINPAGRPPDHRHLIESQCHEFPTHDTSGEYNNENKPGVLFSGEKHNTVTLGAIMFF
jgi:hypothetical protein